MAAAAAAARKYPLATNPRVPWAPEEDEAILRALDSGVRKCVVARGDGMCQWGVWLPCVWRDGVDTPLQVVLWDRAVRESRAAALRVAHNVSRVRDCVLVGRV